MEKLTSPPTTETSSRSALLAPSFVTNLIRRFSEAWSPLAAASRRERTGIAVFVVRNRELLLVEQGGVWGVPEALVAPSESLDAAVRRTVVAATGFEGVPTGVFRVSRTCEGATSTTRFSVIARADAASGEVTAPATRTTWVCMDDLGDIELLADVGDGISALTRGVPIAPWEIFGDHAEDLRPTPPFKRCSGCNRHVRVSERSCPFCTGAAFQNDPFQRIDERAPRAERSLHGEGGQLLPISGPTVNASLDSQGRTDVTAVDGFGDDDLERAPASVYGGPPVE